MFLSSSSNKTLCSRSYFLVAWSARSRSFNSYKGEKQYSLLSFKLLEHISQIPARKCNKLTTWGSRVSLVNPELVPASRLLEGLTPIYCSSESGGNRRTPPKKFAFFVSTHSSYVTLSAVTSLSRKILERRGIGIYVLLAPFSDFAGFFFFFFFHPTAFYSETFIPFSELTKETRSKAHRKIRKPYSHTVVQCLVQDWS